MIQITNHKNCGPPWPKIFIWPMFGHPGQKIGQKFLSDEKSRAFYVFAAYPIEFFWWPTLKKVLIFFLFKVSTYVFGMDIIFLLTLLKILIWGEKVLTLCQKMHFFWQSNTFSFRNCKKKNVFDWDFWNWQCTYSPFSRHVVS